MSEGATEQAPLPELLTIPCAAKRLGIGRRQIERAIANGELAVHQIGWRRVRWTELLRWIDSQRVEPTHDAKAHAKARVDEVLQRLGSR